MMNWNELINPPSPYGGDHIRHFPTVKVIKVPAAIVKGGKNVRNQWALKYLADLKTRNPALYASTINKIKALMGEKTVNLSGLGEFDLLDFLGTSTKIVGDYQQTQAEIDAKKKEIELREREAALNQESASYGFANTQEMYDTIKKIAIPALLLGGAVIFLKNRKKR